MLFLISGRSAKGNFSGQPTSKVSEFPGNKQEQVIGVYVSDEFSSLR